MQSRASTTLDVTRALRAVLLPPPVDMISTLLPGAPGIGALLGMHDDAARALPPDPSHCGTPHGDFALGQGCSAGPHRRSDPSRSGTARPIPGS